MLIKNTCLLSRPHSTLIVSLYHVCDVFQLPTIRSDRRALTPTRVKHKPDQPTNSSISFF